MESLNVVRVKRKADEEPAEALVIALKRSKREDDQSDEVFLKLATTFTSEAEFNNDFLQNAITQDKLKKVQRRKSPKHTNSSSNFSTRLNILKLERKQRREQVLADRRLILAQNLSKEDKEESENSEGATGLSTEVRGMFKLYDIIEENEESKSTEQDEEKTTSQSSILCNGVNLIRLNGSGEDINDYVFDVYYVTDGNLDDRFVDGSVSVQPWAVSEELTYDSDEPEEYYEDEDDSNEECNWRNDYPDDDSDFENERDSDYSNDDENVDPVVYAMHQKFKNFAIDEDKLSKAYTVYKTRVIEGFANDDDDFIL